MRVRLPFVVVALLVAVGCSTPSSTAPTPPSVPPVGEVYEVEIDPAAFSTTIDNPYFPLAPGSRWVYRGAGEDGVERNVVVVTDRTKVVMGVETVVVRDAVWIDGELAELTFDWFAQDVGGTVWYFGEDSREYEGGAVTSTEGSWEAGVDGALPGVVMLADPQPGDTYRQEYLAGEAEDVGRVIANDASITIDDTTYQPVVVIEDTSPIEQGLLEHKTYAQSVGFVHERVPDEPDASVELVSFTAG